MDVDFRLLWFPVMGIEMIDNYSFPGRDCKPVRRDHHVLIRPTVAWGGDTTIFSTPVWSYHSGAETGRWYDHSSRTYIYPFLENVPERFAGNLMVHEIRYKDRGVPDADLSSIVVEGMSLDTFGLLKSTDMDPGDYGVIST